MRYFTSFLVLTACVAWCVHAEVFTSMAHIERALHAERDIAMDINAYIVAEEERLGQLKRVSEELLRHSAEVLDNVNKHINHPVSAYVLIKKLTLDWDRNVDPVINNNTLDNLMQTIDERKQDMPSADDLQGAAEALLRLQDTYQLDTTQIANGDVGPNKAEELNAQECFDIGKQAYGREDFYHAVLWLEEALVRDEAEYEKSYYRFNILDYLAYSLTMLGNMKRARKLTEELLEIDPDHTRAQNNLRYYDALENTDDKMGDDGPGAMKDQGKDEYRRSDEFLAYEALCRGEEGVKNRKEHKLVCRYTNRNSTALILQPVKEEEMYANPFIAVYHDIISDSEMNVIKGLALPRLNRATVQNAKTGELEFASYRISKSAWLREEEDPVIRRVNDRIEAITNLDIKTAEELQVANYGIGGHYEPHFDFARKEEKDAFKSLGTGNRIATYMHYMSDVTAGGATVFPYLGVKLWPEKGAAAFWYNLYKNGDGIYETRHAACPVLVGTKWVSNKWIHERGQEFRRKCGLSERE